MSATNQNFGLEKFDMANTNDLSGKRFEKLEKLDYVNFKETK